MRGGMALFPTEDDLTTVARLHDVECHLKIVHMVSVGEHVGDIEAAAEHLSHLVPGFK